MNSTTSTELAVPTYSAVNNDDLLTRIEAAPNVKFPILHSPAGRSTNLPRVTADADWEAWHEAYRIETDIVDAFFAAIENGHDDIVADFISRGWVSPDTTNRWGETPLIIAVRVGKLPMVSRLVALGATVNEFGRARDSDDIVRPEDFPKRTPLMVAAERGHLALVKVLIQDYGAKHELIAPDGAMALRLAAVNRHREIVHFLPKVRGGSWKRWKHVHHKQMERVRRAGRRLWKFLCIFFWDFPKLLVYDAPKEICRAAWNCRHRVKAFLKELPKEIKKQVVALPGHIKSAGKAVWKGVKEIPSFMKSFFLAIWKVVKEIPSFMKSFFLAIWEVIKQIPGAFMTVLRWIDGGLKDIGQAIFDIIAKALSFLHTAVMAVVTFLSGVTLRDIWDGFCYLVRAIFVDAPKAIGAFIIEFGKTTYDVLKTLFGTLGSWIWHIGEGILWLIQYIPRRIWTMIEAMGTSLVKAFEEVMVFVNPKRM